MHPDPEQQMRIIRLIWTVLFISPLILMGVMHVVRASQAEAPSPENAAGMTVPLIAICFVMAVVAPLIGRFLEATTLRNARTQQPPPQPVALLTTLTIARTALGEGPGLFAGVAYFLTGSPLVLVPLGLSLVAMLWVRPTDERLDAIRHELGGTF
jgi:hypothetical protein